MLTMRVPLYAQAFLNGFTGGMVPTRRPSAPTSFFAEPEEESDSECNGETEPRDARQDTSAT
jgi:hypothetical protein